MSSLDIWWVIAMAAVIVLAQRVSFLLLPASFTPRGALLRALSFAPLAALMAICAPEIFATVLAYPTNVAQWFYDGRLLAALVVLACFLLRLNAVWGLLAAGFVLWLS
jgi:branched-subunit amino acid transport protein